MSIKDTIREAQPDSATLRLKTLVKSHDRLTAAAEKDPCEDETGEVRAELNEAIAEAKKL